MRKKKDTFSAYDGSRSNKGGQNDGLRSSNKWINENCKR